MGGLVAGARSVLVRREALECIERAGPRLIQFDGTGEFWTSGCLASKRPLSGAAERQSLGVGRGLMAATVAGLA